jgi:hypothetical protein
MFVFLKVLKLVMETKVKVKDFFTNRSKYNIHVVCRIYRYFSLLMKTCLNLVMAEILMIQFHENGGQLQVIILMVLWSRATSYSVFQRIIINEMVWYWGGGVGKQTFS